MTCALIRISLILIPCCLQIHLYPFLAAAITDFRGCKEFLAVAFSLAIINSIRTERRTHSLDQHLWPTLLVGYLCVHRYLVSQLEFSIPTDAVITQLWSFKPLIWTMLYYGFFEALTYRKFSLKEIEAVLRTLMWTGFAAAIYLLIQTTGFDDYQKLNGFRSNATESAAWNSFFTHPNYAGSFLALCVPFAFFFRRWMVAVTLMMAVCLTHSSFAIGAMLLGNVFYLTVKRMSWGLCVLGLVGMVFVIHSWTDPATLADHGRFNVWEDTWRILTRSPFANDQSFLIFGYGLGSFAFLYPASHPVTSLDTTWVATHNEPLQLLFETGLCGLGLFAMMIKEFFDRCWSVMRKYEIVLAMGASSVTIILCSLGLFIWQIEPHRYISVLLAGMIFSFTKHPISEGTHETV